MALVVIGGRCAADDDRAPPARAASDLVVPASALEHRRIVTADDFRDDGPPQIRIRAPERVHSNDVRPEPGDASMEASALHRRTNTHNDSQRIRDRRRSAAVVSPAHHPPASDGLDDVVAPAPEPGEPADATPRATEKRLIAAGTRVRATLADALVLGAGSETAVLRVGARQALPRGSKLIGSARASAAGRVTIAIRSVVLPDGTSIRARGEASLDSRPNDDATDDDGSVAGDVASGTASRLTRDALGGGLLGGAASDALSSRRRRSRPRPRARTITVPASTHVSVLFTDEVLTPNSR